VVRSVDRGQPAPGRRRVDRGTLAAHDVSVDSTIRVLHCATTLAQLEAGTAASAAQLAQYYELPFASLAKQLQLLVRAGVLSTPPSPEADSSWPGRRRRSRCSPSWRPSTDQPALSAAVWSFGTVMPLARLARFGVGRVPGAGSWLEYAARSVRPVR
jgi:hypothetical protein